MGRPRKNKQAEKKEVDKKEAKRTYKPNHHRDDVLVDILRFVIGSLEYTGTPSLSDEERLRDALNAIYGHKDGRASQDDGALLRLMFEIIRKEKVSVRKGADMAVRSLSADDFKKRGEASTESMRDRLAAKYTKAGYKSFSPELNATFEDVAKERDAARKRIFADFMRHYFN